MTNVDTIKNLVGEATPSPGNMPPSERKSKEQIDNAKEKLQKIIEKNPEQVFLTMAENGVSGLDHFSIDTLTALGPTAITVFTNALTDTDHPWHTYSKVIYLFAQIDNSSTALDTIMQRLTSEITERLAFAYRFYPMAGSALKLFDTGEVAKKIIDVLKNTSWNNRYIISMSLRNVCRGNPNKAEFDNAFLLLLDMAEDAEPNSADADKITKCVAQVEFALEGK